MTHDTTCANTGVVTRDPHGGDNIIREGQPSFRTGSPHPVLGQLHTGTPFSAQGRAPSSKALASEAGGVDLVPESSRQRPLQWIKTVEPKPSCRYEEGITDQKGCQGKETEAWKLASTVHTKTKKEGPKPLFFMLHAQPITESWEGSSCRWQR